MTASKEDYISYRIEKSNEIFEDAKLLCNNARWNSCINRLYYSSFYLLSALLHKNGIRTTTHKGVKVQFNQHFVKTGRVSKDNGRLYSNLFDWRHESDYADFIEFEKDMVVPLIHEVEAFNKTILELLKK